MTGPKTNEGARKVGERVGTRCTLRMIGSPASKVRPVLDLIRGKHVREADEILQFTERGVARDIRKALTSAVANAQHNEGQDPDELFVAACFADEGPTMKRFQPRARGRAGRIRKRTCHITVIVARLSEEDLEKRRRREESKPAARRGRGATSAADARRARVARSRQRAAEQARARGEHEGHEHEGHEHEGHEHEEATEVLAEAGHEESHEHHEDAADEEGKA